MGQLQAHFSPAAGFLNIEFCWSRKEVLVSIRIFSVHIRIRFGRLRIRSGKLRIWSSFPWLMFCLQSILLNGMYPRIFTGVEIWVKSCGQFSVEFEEGTEATLVLVRTCDRDTFRRVCVAVLSKYSGDARRDAAVLGQLLCVVGPSVSLVALVRSSHVLRDRYVEFAGSGYREKLVEYPIFDLRILK